MKHSTRPDFFDEIDALAGHRSGPLRFRRRIMVQGVLRDGVWRFARFAPGPFLVLSRLRLSDLVTT